MSLLPVARRYAKALFDLANEEGALDRVTQEIRDIGESVNSSPDLALVLANPTVSPATRKAIMNDLLSRMGASPVVRNAVLLITDHGRALSLPRIANVLTDLADERAGRVRAEVTSAEALSETQYQRVSQALEKMTGRKISLVRKVDASLIGGVVTRIGDKVYDGSVKTRLAEMRRSLLPS